MSRRTRCSLLTSAAVRLETSRSWASSMTISHLRVGPEGTFIWSYLGIFASPFLFASARAEARRHLYNTAGVVPVPVPPCFSVQYRYRYTEVQHARSPTVTRP